MKTRLLRIASSDQVPELSDNNSRFTVSLNETLDVQKIKGYSVLSVSFPNVFLNVKEEDLTNRIVILTDDGTGPIEQVIDLPEGFYNIDDLSSALEIEIDALISPDSISITPKSNVDQRLVFQTSGSTTISYTTQQGKLHKLLGITENSDFLSTYTCDSMPKLQGVTNAYVHSRVLAQNNLIDSEGRIFSVAVSVPIKAEFGYWNHWENPDEELHSVMFEKPRNLQQINIVLRDLDGAVLDIEQNELIVVLRVFY
jgi:hypothetical protein